jgi:hypothetical protein
MRQESLRRAGLNGADKAIPAAGEAEDAIR